jgi:hypothetical protein
VVGVAPLTDIDVLLPFMPAVNEEKAHPTT